MNCPFTPLQIIRHLALRCIVLPQRTQRRLILNTLWLYTIHEPSTDNR